jgi:hypothetical protein
MKTKEQRSWTVEKVVGHLVEIRVTRLDSVDEVKKFSDAIVRMGASTPDAVLLVDLRTPVVFPQPVAAAVSDLMTRANKVRRKTAIMLAGDHAVFSMQLGRLVRQVGDPKRQTFNDVDDALTWLGDSLTDAEKRRAKTFLGPSTGLSTAS